MYSEVRNWLTREVFPVALLPSRHTRYLTPVSSSVGLSPVLETESAATAAAAPAMAVSKDDWCEEPQLDQGERGLEAWARCDTVGMCVATGERGSGLWSRLPGWLGNGLALRDGVLGKNMKKNNFNKRELIIETSHYITKS